MLPVLTVPGWEAMTGVRDNLETDPTITCQESKALLLGQKPLRHCLMLAGLEASNYPDYYKVCTESVD